jgi:hypothetical protein
MQQLPKVLLAVAVWQAKSDNISSFLEGQVMPKKPTAKVKVIEADSYGHKKALVIKKALISRRKKQAKAKVTEAEVIKALIGSWEKPSLANVTAAEPFGPGFVELSIEAFREAVQEVWDRQTQKKQDSYGTIDGELVAVKPDGRVEPVTFEVKDTTS